MSKRLDVARAYGFKGTEEELREAASITVASTPPLEPSLGDIWIDPRTKKTWVVPPLEVRTQSEEPEPKTGWRVPGDESGKIFATRGEALARAWEITPAGQQRPEPVTASAGLLADGTATGWVSENTLRWVGYAGAELEQSDRLHQCTQLAMADMVIRAGETGDVLDLTTLRSYSFFDADMNQYRVEITVKMMPK